MSVLVTDVFSRASHRWNGGVSDRVRLRSVYSYTFTFEFEMDKETVSSRRLVRDRALEHLSVVS
jgi:hypothetical protein